MKLDNFIKRPVLSTVISIIIVIWVFWGWFPSRHAIPGHRPPYRSGKHVLHRANAETVLNSVIAPLEEQINGVENMMYMTSTATNTGDASIEVYFKQGTARTWPR